MLYQKPKMEILKFKMENVICASVDDSYDGNDDNSSDASGEWD